MVFPKALPFARFGIHKSLTHAYTQQFVAASQPWNQQPSSLQHRLQQYHALNGNNSAKNGGIGSKIVGVAGLGAGVKKEFFAQDNVLAEYFKEWQNNQKLGAGHWTQYQFRKSIEWTETSAVEESAEVQEAEDAVFAEQDAQSRLRDEVIAVEESQRSTTPNAVQSEKASTEKVRSVQDPVDAFTDTLVELSRNRSFAEIPETFRAMREAGITPNAVCYNILLESALELPRSADEAISKSLDVYSDMIRHDVVPTMETFGLMLPKIARHALSMEEMSQMLEEQSARYSRSNGNLAMGNEADRRKHLEENNSLDIATRLFDTATSLYPNQAFSTPVYSLLIKAYAANDRIADVTKLYAHMENNNLTPPAKVFASLIPALARTGDIENAMDSYNEYKTLAQRSEGSMERADADVYASVIKALIIDGQDDTARHFLDKLVKRYPEETQNVYDMMGLKAFLPELLKRGMVDEAYEYTTDLMKGPAHELGLYYTCLSAADANNDAIALKAYESLASETNIVKSSIAMSAMFARRGDMVNADKYWNITESVAPLPELADLASLHVAGYLDAGLDGNAAVVGLRRARSTFRRLRAEYPQQEMLVKIQNAYANISRNIVQQRVILGPSASIQLMYMMEENQIRDPELQAHALAFFGPDEISQLDWFGLEALAQVQAGFVLAKSPFDIGSAARLAGIIEMMGMNRPSNKTGAMIEEALTVLENPEMSARWSTLQYPVTSPVFDSAAFAPPTPVVPETPAIPDNYDPYATSTDARGSATISDLLERPGNANRHLEEALVRFRAMRNQQKHPRFFTYAKLITSACKAGRLELAEEILGFARQDIPYDPQYHVVRHGWANMLDAMVAGCLTCNRRDLADGFRGELASMGASPSANTFGLYITTLKESTKSSDEASEAINIFMQAKAEGVTPSPFLYNALIGKLGKARRIDDVLFYFTEMRALNIRPTCVTYGTVVNALVRVSNEGEAVKVFDEMESQPAYKPRPAPYHSMMQFYLNTKGDRTKVLEYYQRMKDRRIEPTSHTFKLLIDAYATLEPVEMTKAEEVINGDMKRMSMRPEAVHYAALIHAKGYSLMEGAGGKGDLEGAERVFGDAMKEVDAGRMQAQACLFQSMLEALHEQDNRVAASASEGAAAVAVSSVFAERASSVLEAMRTRRVGMTAYVANALIGGWSKAGRLAEAERAYRGLRHGEREPSTYEAMTRAYVAAGERKKAEEVVREAVGRGYPAAVGGRIVDLLGGTATGLH